MAATCVNVLFWLSNVIAWDGLLPVLVFSSPVVLDWLLPGNLDAIQVAAVVIPMAALIARCYIGRRHILANHCSPAIQDLQTMALCAGIGLLLTTRL